jgi:hypothetical protein
MKLWRGGRRGYGTLTRRITHCILGRAPPAMQRYQLGCRPSTKSHRIGRGRGGGCFAVGMGSGHEKINSKFSTKRAGQYLAAHAKK